MDETKRVMLGMPGYGSCTAGAAHSFWQATNLPPENVLRTYREGSLLACTFNMLWCDALNHKLVQGHQLDYFAMQHADVESEPLWLDMMIEELERHNLDVLGAVVPIKDQRGLTSIALERRDADPWRPLCRLTMTEVFRLPETFTAEDIGYPLLLNTGLWVCRLDPKWITENIHFTVNDAIIFDKNSKAFTPKCEPEDWNFSRQLNKLGLRIGATRKVRTIHRGPWEVGSATPWGTNPFDSEWIEKSVIPDDGFNFPHDVEGWLSFNEGKALADIARGKRVLEIGSYCGRSSICIAQTARHLTAVDYHDGRGTPAPRNTYNDFIANLTRYGLRDKVLVCSPDDQVLESFDSFDVIFIDGAHDLESVRADIAIARKLIAPGGLITFHDYNSPIDPEVTQAINEFVADGAEILSTHDSVAVVRPPAEIPLEV